MTRKQLLGLGLDDYAVGYRVRKGRLYRVHHGVYGVGRPAVTPIERAAAAVLACGPGAALSHGSAMTLWGFWKRWDTPFEVSTARDRRPKGICVHRTRKPTGRDVRRHLGIVVTSPARTILDVAPRLSERSLKRAVNDARHSKLLSLEALEETLKQHPRHPGVRCLLPFLEHPEDKPSRSDWEDEFPAFCERFGLPRPVMNATVCGFEVDAAFPEEKVIVELDSWGFHSSRTSFEDDRERDATTAAAGWQTVRITWRRFEEKPRREAQRLHTILAARRGRTAHRRHRRTRAARAGEGGTAPRRRPAAE